MSPDQFDSLVARHLEEAAPRETPSRVLDGALDRIAHTPQRGSGWHLGRVGGLLAAAAVILLAVVVGTQFAGVVNRPVGADPSPSAAPSAIPAASASPSASVGPTVTASPSAAPSSAAPSPSPAASEPAVADDGLLVRVVTSGGGPTDPASLLPTATVMADGTVIWRPFDPMTDFTGFVTRKLTPAGLEELRQHIFADGLLDADAAYELEPLPGAQPPGRGVAVHVFTVGGAADEVVVTSVGWLGDEEEATYYQPAPEREALDALAQRMRDPESLVGESAWEAPASAYRAPDYQLVLYPARDVPPYGNPDIAEVPIGFAGPVDEFGAQAGDPRPPLARCGVVSQEEAAEIVEALTALGVAETNSVAMDRATFASLDWAEGSGIVDLYLLPRMPDGYPECEDQP